MNVSKSLVIQIDTELTDIRTILETPTFKPPTTLFDNLPDRQALLASSQSVTNAVQSSPPEETAPYNLGEALTTLDKADPDTRELLWLIFQRPLATQLLLSTGRTVSPRIDPVHPLFRK